VYGLTSDHVENQHANKQERKQAKPRMAMIVSLESIIVCNLNLNLELKLKLKLKLMLKLMLKLRLSNNYDDLLRIDETLTEHISMSEWQRLVPDIAWPSPQHHDSTSTIILSAFIVGMTGCKGIQDARGDQRC